MTLDVHVVTHTHWDREWYHSHERFRQRLVALVDEILADAPRDDASFLLDGQAIVIEDYLTVRPERAGEIATLLADARLEAGPWYVLADGLIPGGEALVRNLLAGRAVLARLGASAPPVLYCPDSFGHPAAMPALAAGFGLPLAIVWRGYGGRRWPPADTARWFGLGDDAVVLFHLPRAGYEHGASLPWHPDLAHERWMNMCAELVERSVSGVLLVLNGADHHALQPRLPEALAALAVAARPDLVRRSSLTAFARAHLARVANTELPEVRGELRDSYGYTWTLSGTLGTRAYQKRRNAIAEKLLVRDAEPWAALGALRGGYRRGPLATAAWKSLLAAHPHDTLCGCSIDPVAAAMDVRLAAASAQAVGLRDDALAELVGHDAAAARERVAAWKPVIIVRNPAARARGGVALLDVIDPIAVVPVGLGAAAPSHVPDVTPLEFGAGVQVLGAEVVQHRTESPRHYPRNERAYRTRVLVWMEPVSGYGTSTLTRDQVAVAPGPPAPVTSNAHSFSNGALEVAVSPAGEIRIEQIASKRVLESAVVLEDLSDQGDLYTPALRGRASTPRFAGAAILHSGPLRAEVVTRWILDPEGHRDAEACTVAIHASLDAGAEFVRMRVYGNNRAVDHRLRVGFRPAIPTPEVWADAAFGPVRRKPLVVPPEDARMEQPPPTAPLHRYVSVFGADGGATLISDGLAEYEATDDGTIFVTLLRAVGQLSRNDLPERPGHAGWPSPTPEAQCLGPFEAEFALLLHGPRTPATIDAIERAADDALLPLEGHTLRDAIHVPAPVQGVELEGEGMAVSAIKESEDQRGVILRCVNLLDEPRVGRWHLGTVPAEAWLARLDETPVSPLPVEGRTVAFEARPRQVVTVLVRR